MVPFAVAKSRGRTACLPPGRGPLTQAGARGVRPQLPGHPATLPKLVRCSARVAYEPYGLPLSPEIPRPRRAASRQQIQGPIQGVFRPMLERCRYRRREHRGSTQLAGAVPCPDSVPARRTIARLSPWSTHHSAAGAAHVALCLRALVSQAAARRQRPLLWLLALPAWTVAARSVVARSCGSAWCGDDAGSLLHPARGG